MGSFCFLSILHLDLEKDRFLPYMKISTVNVKTQAASVQNREAIKMSCFGSVRVRFCYKSQNSVMGSASFLGY